MPRNNQFRHQQYPTAPTIAPVFQHLNSTVDDFDFSRLHTELSVREVVVVHGTFMGDDPVGINDIIESAGDSVPWLNKPLNTLAARLRERFRPLADDVTGDIGNYSDDFLKHFQTLVGGDPIVTRLTPTWSGQNHHFARADLAVRLFCHLADAAPEPGENNLFWGHSHAGNAFAILSNLLANDHESVQRFFDAAGPTLRPHWERAQAILKLAPSAHPWALSSMFVTFGTPVRYGWDTSGCRSLAHVLHHHDDSGRKQITGKPLFPFYSPADVLSAKHGDWVQSFAIAGTDVTSPTSNSQNKQFAQVLESSLEEIPQTPDTRFIPSRRLRELCSRWKTGTRCHADGQNFLVSYEPCGRRTKLGTPIEETMFGHGVATTIDWLPAHLAMLIESPGWVGAQSR